MDYNYPRIKLQLPAQTIYCKREQQRGECILKTSPSLQENQAILEAALLAGKVMLESGAETSRVEDTMERIIRYAIGDIGTSSAYTYVTVNGIFAKLDRVGTQFYRIDRRRYDLNKITKVNQLSRDFAGGRIGLEEMHAALQAAEKESMGQKLRHKLIYTASLSGSIMLIFGGSFDDLPAAMTAGVVAFLSCLWLTRILKVPFLSECGAAFLGGLAGLCMTSLAGRHLDLVMVGAVVPLVPGIAITNAIRDMMARHYISGVVGAIEALFIAGALGAGIAGVYWMFIL